MHDMYNYSFGCRPIFSEYAQSWRTLIMSSKGACKRSHYFVPTVINLKSRHLSENCFHLIDVPRKSITITLLIAACNKCINDTGRGIHLGNCAAHGKCAV